MLESECLTLNIFISVLHLNVVDQLRNAGEDKATKILREKLKFTTSAKSAGGEISRFSLELSAAVSCHTECYHLYDV